MNFTETEVKSIPIGEHFYIIGETEPVGPFIMEDRSWFTYHHCWGRRPRTNEREKFYEGRKVYPTWKDACLKMASMKQAAAQKLLNEATALLQKSEE